MEKKKKTNSLAKQSGKIIILCDLITKEDVCVFAV